MKIPLVGAPAEYAWMIELLDGTHFPLRAIMFEKDGKEGGRIEVTKIEKKALAANVFEIPSGYPQIPPEQLVGELMAAAMGGVGRPGALPPGVTLPPGAAGGRQLPPLPKR